MNLAERSHTMQTQQRVAHRPSKQTSCMPIFAFFTTKHKRSDEPAAKSKLGRVKKFLTRNKSSEEPSPLQLVLEVEPKPAWKVLGARSKARLALSDLHAAPSSGSEPFARSLSASSSFARTSSNSSSSPEETSAAVLNNRMAWEALGRRRIARLNVAA
eukprot:2757912-Rhodomonas_salina.1